MALCLCNPWLVAVVFIALKDLKLFKAYHIIPKFNSFYFSNTVSQDANKLYLSSFGKSSAMSTVSRPPESTREQIKT